MRISFAFIFVVFFISSCRNTKEADTEVMYIMQGNHRMYYENFTYDSVLIFPDTIFGRNLQAYSDTLSIEFLKPIDTILSKGIVLFKSNASFSSSQPEHSYFIGLKKNEGIKLYHAIDTSLLNQFYSCDAALGMIISNWGKDTLVYMNFEISESGSSPYFASDISFQGIRWWDSRSNTKVFSLYPVSEKFMHRDIILGEYEEEIDGRIVTGSPVIGSIDEHRIWTYQYFFEHEQLRLKLESDEYYRDTDADSSYLSNEEPRRTIQKTADSAEIIFKKLELPLQTLRK